MQSSNEPKNNYSAARSFTLLLCRSGFASRQSNSRKQLTNYALETNDPMAQHHRSIDSIPLQNETKINYLSNVAFSSNNSESLEHETKQKQTSSTTHLSYSNPRKTWHSSPLPPVPTLPNRSELSWKATRAPSLSRHCATKCIIKLIVPPMALKNVRTTYEEHVPQHCKTYPLPSSRSLGLSCGDDRTDCAGPFLLSLDPADPESSAFGPLMIALLVRRDPDWVAPACAAALTLLGLRSCVSAPACDLAPNALPQSAAPPGLDCPGGLDQQPHGG